MIVPYVAPRVEQCDDGTAVRIDGREIGALVAVALDAREREVRLVGGAAVLERDYVVGLVRKERVFFGEATVLATLTRARSHHAPEGRGNV